MGREYGRRQKEKALAKWIKWYRMVLDRDEEEDAQRLARRRINTRRPCSCDACKRKRYSHSDRQKLSRELQLEDVD